MTLDFAVRKLDNTRDGNLKISRFCAKDKSDWIKKLKKKLHNPDKIFETPMGV